MGIAATFDTSIARAYGEVEGSEALGQGVDVIQGPNLNIDRVPQNGRGYEGYGEDPGLVSAMGVADIEGIQSTGALAMAKHFAVYGQETDRAGLDDVVSPRALEEIYLPPFKAAVTQAQVSSVMCAYPQLNGTYQCQDPQLLDVLAQWGFVGFVRSDLGSVHDPLAALTSGTDLLKPGSIPQLANLLHQGSLPQSAVDNAAVQVLTQMFTHGLVGRVDVGSPGAPVNSESHTDFALLAAERSAVLLKNNDSVLPLDPSSDRSVAVIGADASTTPVTTGFGSSKVTSPFVSSPLAAIRSRAGGGVAVSYTDGGSTTAALAPVPTTVLTPASGQGHGLTLTLTQTDPDTGPPTYQIVEPTVDADISPHPTTRQPLGNPALPGSVGRLPDIPSVVHQSLPLGSSGFTTRSHIVLPAGWSDVNATWTGTLTPPRSGLYTFSLQGTGGASLTLDGETAVSDTLNHARGRWSQTVSLVGGHPYRVALEWAPIAKSTPSGESSLTPSTMTLGFGYVSDQISAAVAAARRASVAVVFAADYNSEAFDRPSLSLPGDQDAAHLGGCRGQSAYRGGAQHRWAGAHAVAGIGGRGHRGLVPRRRGRRRHRGTALRRLRSLRTPAGDLSGVQRAHRRLDGAPVARRQPDLVLHREPRRRLSVRPRHRHPTAVRLRVRARLHPVRARGTYRAPPRNPGGAERGCDQHGDP